MKDTSAEEIALAEKLILKEEKHIKKEEIKISHQEKHIELAENRILKFLRGRTLPVLSRRGLNLHSAHYVRDLLIRRFARRQFAFSVAVAVAGVMVWYGLWEIIAKVPILSNWYVSLIVGFAILWFLEKNNDII